METKWETCARRGEFRTNHYGTAVLGTSFALILFALAGSFNKMACLLTERSCLALHLLSLRILVSLHWPFHRDA